LVWETSESGADRHGMYGHTENDYKAHSRSAWRFGVRPAMPGYPMGRGYLDHSARLGLGLCLHLRRINFTFSSEFSYFHTESFDSSSDFADVDGDSEAWKNKMILIFRLGSSSLE